MTENTYIIAAGQEGSDRLKTLAEATWPTTKPFLEQMAIGPGSSVLDLACGNAEIVRRYAEELMAQQGRIVAVDRDAVAVEHAGDVLAGFESAAVVRADLMKDDFGDGELFDFVILRFIASHVNDVRHLLEKAAGHLKPGGRLLVEDVDFDGHVCFPANPAFDRYVNLYKDFADAEGVDATIGRKLVDHVRMAGLEPVHLVGNCPAFYDGAGKQMALATFRLIAGGLAARGLADRESIDAELQDLVSYTADPDSVMSLPHIFQVAARLP